MKDFTTRRSATSPWSPITASARPRSPRPCCSSPRPPPPRPHRRRHHAARPRRRRNPAPDHDQPRARPVRVGRAQDQPARHARLPRLRRRRLQRAARRGRRDADAARQRRRRGGHRGGVGDAASRRRSPTLVVVNMMDKEHANFARRRALARTTGSGSNAVPVQLPIGAGRDLPRHRRPDREQGLSRSPARAWTRRASEVPIPDDMKAAVDRGARAG